jgi:hypothetical protein
LERRERGLEIEFSQMGSDLNNFVSMMKAQQRTLDTEAQESFLAGEYISEPSR